MARPSKVIKALEILQSHTRSGLEAAQIKYLLTIYQHGKSGIALSDLAKEIDMAVSSVGRNAGLMSEAGINHARTGKHAGGWGLIELTLDHTRPRSKIAKLTSKGVKVIEDFLAAFDN